MEDDVGIRRRYDRVMLNFDDDWRYQSPGPLSDEAMEAVVVLIGRVAQMGPEKAILEHFKRVFSIAAESPCYSSSTTSFARQDLRRDAGLAAANAPLFLEALYDGVEGLATHFPGVTAPTVDSLNRFLRQRGAAYAFQPPNLVALGSATPLGLPQPAARSLDAEGQALIAETWAEADRLLAAGKGRQAVTENLWLLETVATAFRGLPLADTTVKGKYFNKIADEYRTHGKTLVLTQVLNWIATLHGFLSSPAGGGVRHGADLASGQSLSAHEAQLYSNLIRSYVSYLLAEYDQMRGGGATTP